MAGVTIRYDSDTDGALDGARDVERSLDDLNDKLGDASSAGQESADDLADAFGDAADDVESSAAEASDAVDDIGDASEESGGSVRGLGRAGKEAMEGDLAGGARAVLPLIAGLGPAAAIAGGVAVGALGLVSDQLERQQKQAEEAKADLVSMYQDAISSGSQYLDKLQIISAAQANFADADRMEDFRKKAEQIGVDVQTYVLAQSGSYEDLKVVIEAAQQAEEARSDEYGDGSITAAQRRELDGIRDIITASDELLQTHEDQRQAAEDTQNVRDALNARERDQINRTSAVAEQRLTGLATLARRPLPPIVPTVDMSQAEQQLAAWRSRFTTSGGTRLTIVADVVDRRGQKLF